MRRSNEGGPSMEAFPFDWDNFQNQFFGEAKWKEGWEGPAGALPWVDRYVRELLAEAVPASFAKTPAGQPSESRVSSVASNMFETHRALIVRIRLAPTIDVSELRLFAGSGELKLSGLPGGEEKTVKLPVPVRIDAAKAVCKHRIMEISLPKAAASPLYEVPIRILE